MSRPASQPPQRPAADAEDADINLPVGGVMLPIESGAGEMGGASASQAIPGGRRSRAITQPSDGGIHTPPTIRTGAGRIGKTNLLTGAVDAGRSITPVNLFAALPRSRSTSTVGSGSPTYPMHLTGLSGPVSPGHPVYAEPPGSVSLHSIAAGRLPTLDADATLTTVKSIGVRGQVAGGGGTAPTRKQPPSILSRIHIPSIKTQLHLKRRLQVVIWAATLLFFLMPLIGIVYTHFATDFQVPPSTFHHKNVDGPFYSTGLRISIGVYGVVYFLYVLVITIWSLRRSNFFPFKIRPLLLVHTSNFWGIAILVWLWTRYVLSDSWSNDPSGEGLFPPCFLSQLMVGVAQFGLIAPYVLRAWQLARIFNAEYSTAAGTSEKRRDRHDPTRASLSTRGAIVPSSPSLNSVFSDDGHLDRLHSAESTPRLAPQQQPSPSRAFLTQGLVLASSTSHPTHSYIPPAIAGGGGAGGVPAANKLSIIAGMNSSQYIPPGSSLMSTPPRNGRAGGGGGGADGGVGASSNPILQGTPQSSTRRGRPAGSSYAYSHTVQVVGVPQSPSQGPHGSPSRRDAGGGSGDYEWSAPTSMQASPMYEPCARALPNFPALDGTLVVPSAVETKAPSKSEQRLRGCLDNLNDTKLAWIYFLLLLPFLSLTILSFYIPSLTGLTNFDCTDCGPETRAARIIWTVFGGLEILAFIAGLYATRRVWDGFEIRRELVLAVGIQFSLFLVTGVTIFTRADEITAESGADGMSSGGGGGGSGGMSRNLSKSSSGLDRFNAFLTLAHELLLIARTVLMFHVSVALPLVESYDLNALPVLKARMRLGGGNHAHKSSMEFRDRSASTSQAVRIADGTPTRRQRRSDSRASDFLLDSDAESRSESPRGSQRGGKLLTGVAGDGTLPGPTGGASRDGGGGLGVALLSDPSLANMFPLSPSSLEQMAFGLSQQQQQQGAYGYSSQVPPSSRGGVGGSIPLTLTYIISHPDYFQYFVSYVSRDAQMELLWSFYISIVLFQDMDEGSNEFERREVAQKIYQRYFDEETLKGNTLFSQWLLSMANVLQQDYCIAHGTAVVPVHRRSTFLLGEREQIQALERVDDDIQRIAACVFAEEDDDDRPSIPRDLFDDFQRASVEIMEVWLYPKFLRSRYYRRLLAEIQKSSIIQTRIEQAHFLDG